MEAMWKKGRGGVILIRCRSGEVLVDVNPTVVQEAVFTLREALTSTGFQEPGSRLNTSD